VFSLILVSASWVGSNAQDADSVFLPPADSAWTLEDSLSVFEMIDSLIRLQEESSASQFAVRINYNSNVLYAGQALGIDQFGLAPGVSYHHKSGLYADVASYFSADYEPACYLTTFSEGYMGIFTDWFTLMANYDHYVYNLGDDITVPYNNAFTVSPNFEVKKFSFRLDYSYYFGTAGDANRIMPGISYNYRTRKLGWIDRITVNPAAYFLWGDEQYTWIEYIPPRTLGEAIRNLRTYGTRYTPVLKEEVYFGLMNYAFTLPITFTKGNLMFNISYTYSIPRSLTDESPALPETGYLSSSLIYYFSIRKRDTLF
jgi:hypothetical protein